jgi:ABC-type polysaccharide/polyol phosphate export permease
MINGILSAWFLGLPELMAIAFWFLLIALPVVYIIHSARKRHEILTELKKLREEVRSLRQEVTGKP